MDTEWEVFLKDHRVQVVLFDHRTGELHLDNKTSSSLAGRTQAEATFTLDTFGGTYHFHQFDTINLMCNWQSPHSPTVGLLGIVTAAQSQLLDGVMVVQHAITHVLWPALEEDAKTSSGDSVTVVERIKMGFFLITQHYRNAPSQTGYFPFGWERVCLPGDRAIPVTFGLKA